ncbi:MAG: ABC transporter ATP-binding protein [Candidatus Riflebacteria bacterium]|nr:ABC transporter ATP-binding protein [Candidatus Riflebacteria bacterium]
MSIIVKAENLNFAYGSRKIIENLSFDINRNHITALLGSNGSGKTTLLKLIAGALLPESGTISFNGKQIKEFSKKELAAKIAFVPQEKRDTFAFPVIEMTAMGRTPYTGFFAKLSKKDYQIAAESLEVMGASHLASRYYTELSGGEKQLVLIARAIAQDSELLILDEPETGLDYGNRIKLLKSIQKLKSIGKTVIFTTHSPEHALWTADNTMLLKNGQIKAYGSTQSTLTETSLSELYGERIIILQNPDTSQGNIMTCVPCPSTEN